MPTTPTSPSTRTHSCFSVYFRSANSIRVLSHSNRVWVQKMTSTTYLSVTNVINWSDEQLQLISRNCCERNWLQPIYSKCKSIDTKPFFCWFSSVFFPSLIAQHYLRPKCQCTVEQIDSENGSIGKWIRLMWRETNVCPNSKTVWRK